jgi:hypothetical protein
MKRLPYIQYYFLAVALLFSSGITAQHNEKPVSKPLYDDPVYHGAADPVIIYNKKKKRWWMLYTNRRASINDSTVQWVYGTRIGIAESKDGRKWKYAGTCNINYRPDEGYTHWAPAVIEHKGVYHIHLTYEPGTFKDWNHPAIAARGEGPKTFYWQGKYFMIVDAWKGMEVYSSDDLLKWTKQPARILEDPLNHLSGTKKRTLYFYFGMPRTTNSKEQYSRPAVDNVF